MPEEDPEAVDLVLQYLYKLDYNDSPSATGNARESITDNSIEVLSGDQSPTSLGPTSAAAEEQSSLFDEDGEPADDSTQDLVTEILKEVSVSPSGFACLFVFPDSIA